MSYRIVVGVGRSGAPTALRWAARQAAAYDGEVIAVRAWRPPSPTSGPRGTPPPGGGVDRDLGRAEALEHLDRHVAEVLGEGIPVKTEVAHGGKRKVLLAAAADADVLVVEVPPVLEGENTPGFAQRLVRASTCPVVLIPPALVERPPSRVGEAARRVGGSVVEAAGRSGRPGLSHPRPDL